MSRTQEGNHIKLCLGMRAPDGRRNNSGARAVRYGQKKQISDPGY